MVSIGNQWAGRCLPTICANVTLLCASTVRTCSCLALHVASSCSCLRDRRVSRSSTSRDISARARSTRAASWLNWSTWADKRRFRSGLVRLFGLCNEIAGSQLDPRDACRRKSPAATTKQFWKPVRRIRTLFFNRWRAVRCGILQRWPWIRSAGVDSGRILRFSFGPGIKILWKTGPGATFQFRQRQESAWPFFK